MRYAYILVLALLCLYLNGHSQDAPSLTQTVRGIVVDKSLQSPLGGATVEIITCSPVKAAVCDVNGNFRLENVPVGRHDILVTSVNYKTFTLPNVLVNSGKETVLTIAMEEEIVEVVEVVVKAEKDKAKANNAFAVVSANNLRPEEINRFAGSRQDPSRMAANYAGVAGGGDQRNDIIVRGNSPIGVLWRLEGVDIPNPNHFTFTGNTGGAFSILNNNLLAGSDFLTGAFPAEYGNKTAAVFDVKMRNGNNEKREHTAQAGLNGLEFTTEGPISRKQGSSYLASYRLFSFKALDKLGVSIGANGIPQYQDFTFKVNIPAGKAGTFTAWTIAGKSTIFLKDPEVIAPDTIPNPQTFSTDDFRSEMFASGASHTYKFSEKTKGKLIVSASGSRIGVVSSNLYKKGNSLMDYDLKNTEGQYLANYTLTHKFNTRHLFKTGIMCRDIYYSNHSTYFDYDDSTYYTALDQKGHASLWQAFGQWQYRVTENLTVNPGLYSQLFTLNNKWSVEPRASATYTITSRQRASLAAGLHSQTHTLAIYQYRFFDKSTGTYRQPNLNLGFTKALHVVAGYNYSFTNNLRGKVEVYFQHLYNVPVSVDTSRGANVYSILNTGADYGFYVLDRTVNKGKGRNYGTELTLERYFNKDYYFLTNLSLFRSEYQGSDHVWRSTAFDLGHVLNLIGGKEFHLHNSNKKVISADFRINHTGGRRIIAADQEASLKEGKAVYDYSHAYQTKVKDYFRADIKISYNINNPKATHNFFIAADNLLNTKNVLNKGWSVKQKKEITYYQLGLFPYLGYRGQF